MRRAVEVAVWAVLVARVWLEGQAERRWVVARVTAESRVDDAQLERVLQVTRLDVRLRPDASPADLLADAWNRHEVLRAIAVARVDVDDHRTFVLSGEDKSALSVTIVVDRPSRLDRAASLAARAALLVLPGGRRRR